MTFWFLFFTFTALWIAINGASIRTYNTSSLFKDAHIMTENEKFWFCERDMWKYKFYKDRYENVYNSFVEIVQNVEQQIEKEGWLKNLDSILHDSCYTVFDMDTEYNMTTDVLKFCFEREDTFTPEERLIAKEKLKKRYCYLKLRSYLLKKYQKSCESVIYQSISQYSRKYDIQNVPIMDMLFGTPKLCPLLLGEANCWREANREQCNSTNLEHWEKLYDLTSSYHGCNFNKRFISRDNSSEA